MLLTDRDSENYVEIDKETTKTYLFNRLASSNVDKYTYGRLEIDIMGVEYTFSNDLNLIEVTPSVENSYALTTKGIVKWKNPLRTIYLSRNLKVVHSLSEDKIICSNYICFDLPSKNYIKIGKNQLVRVDIFKYEKLDAKETDYGLVIQYANTNPLSILGAKIGSRIYPLHIPYLYNNAETILPKGTCFRVRKFYEAYNLKEIYFPLNAFQDLCY